MPRPISPQVVGARANDLRGPSRLRAICPGEGGGGRRGQLCAHRRHAARGHPRGTRLRTASADGPVSEGLPIGPSFGRLPRDPASDRFRGWTRFGRLPDGSRLRRSSAGLGLGRLPDRTRFGRLPLDSASDGFPTGPAWDSSAGLGLGRSPDRIRLRTASRPDPASDGLSIGSGLGRLPLDRASDGFPTGTGFGRLCRTRLLDGLPTGAGFGRLPRTRPRTASRPDRLRTLPRTRPRTASRPEPASDGFPTGSGGGRLPAGPGFGRLPDRTRLRMGPTARLSTLGFSPAGQDPFSPCLPPERVAIVSHANRHHESRHR